MTCLRFGWSPRRPPYCASKHVLMIEIMLKLTYVVERDRNSLLVKGLALTALVWVDFHIWSNIWVTFCLALFLFLESDIFSRFIHH